MFEFPQWHELISGIVVVETTCIALVTVLDPIRDPKGVISCACNTARRILLRQTHQQRQQADRSWLYLIATAHDIVQPRLSSVSGNIFGCRTERVAGGCAMN